MASGSYILNANEWHMLTPTKEQPKKTTTYRKGDDIDVTNLSDERLEVLTKGPNPALVKKGDDVPKSNGPAKKVDGNKAEVVQPEG